MIGRDCTALCRKAAMTRPYLRACTHMEASGRDTAYGVASRDNDSLEILPIYEWKSLCSIRTSSDCSTSSSFSPCLTVSLEKLHQKADRNSFFMFLVIITVEMCETLFSKSGCFFLLFITRSSLFSGSSGVYDGNGEFKVAAMQSPENSTQIPRPFTCSGKGFQGYF